MDRDTGIPLTPAALGRRIADAREAAGLSQADLGAHLGLPQSAVSRVESGSRQVSSLELARAATRMAVSVADLLESDPLTERLRIAARATGAARIDAALERVRDLVRFAQLIDWPAARQASSVFEVVGRGPAEQGRSLANRVRDAWGLDDDPIINLENVCETHAGLHVAVESKGIGCHGLLARVDGMAIALINGSANEGRRRFTVAHELCHFLAGDGREFAVMVDQTIAGTQPEERRANSFAGHFLMPVRAVRRYVRERTVDEGVVVELQYTFGVSYEAMLVQLAEVGLVAAADRTRLASRSPAAAALSHGYGDHYRNATRAADRPPAALVAGGVQAYVRGEIGIEPLASLLRTPPDELRCALDDAGITRAGDSWEGTATA